MSSAEWPDPVVQALAALPPVAPDVERAERVRLRCRAVLTASGDDRVALLMEPAISAGCAAYALHVARLAILLSR